MELNTEATYSIELNYNFYYIGEGKAGGYLTQKVGGHITKLKILKEVFDTIDEGENFTLYYRNEHSFGNYSFIEIYINEEGIWYQKNNKKMIIASKFEIDLIKRLYERRTNAFKEQLKECFSNNLKIQYEF
jgi:hypothetical protein